VNRIVRRISVIVTAVAFMIGAVFVAPAFAAYENCPAAFCTYTGKGGTGTLYYYTGAGYCINIGGGLNDTMSSAKNNWPGTNADAVVYRDANCNPHVTVSPGNFGFRVRVASGGGSVGDFGAFAMDNAGSSIWIGPGNP